MSSSRDQTEAEVPIASLIDVVFLLIMFFVVTADLDAEATDTTLKLVKADNIKKPKDFILNPNKIVINIYDRGSGDAEYKVDGYSLTDSQLISHFKRTYGVTKDKKKQLAIIRSAGAVKHKYIDVALRAVTEAKYAKIKITAEVAAEE